MGTRADFYIGKTELKWLGSIAWDGYPTGIPEVIAENTKGGYLERIKNTLSVRDDWTAPEMGWPWPWDDSYTTDCAYTYFEGRVWMEVDTRWIPVEFYMMDAVEEIDFPDMSKRRKLAMGTPRDSIMIATVNSHGRVVIK